jgi:hypothetical protein
MTDWCRWFWEGPNWDPKFFVLWLGKKEVTMHQGIGSELGLEVLRKRIDWRKERDIKWRCRPTLQLSSKFHEQLPKSRRSLASRFISKHSRFENSLINQSIKCNFNFPSSPHSSRPRSLYPPYSHEDNHGRSVTSYEPAPIRLALTLSTSILDPIRLPVAWPISVTMQRRTLFMMSLAMR